MSPNAVAAAARLFVAARVNRTHIRELPPDVRPESVADAHAIQEATAKLLGERIVGWKAMALPTGEFVRGPIFASRFFRGPANIPATLVPMLAIEVEIAFRFRRGFPAREDAYRYEEVADGVIPFAAIEVVDSRFECYRDAPVLHRVADCASNGAFVAGSVRHHWRSLDLSSLWVTLNVAGAIVTEHAGGHPVIDPLLPAVALVNSARDAGGVSAGQFTTTGSYTGLTRVGIGERVLGSFKDFGSVEMSFLE